MPSNAPNTKIEKATFAAGCFWGIEDAFHKVPGVTSATSGYTGGSYPNPAYPEVCSGTTGHAEAVEVEYDPGQISYGDLLDVFWSIHDPTQLNRQGPDIGSQYRSVIFFHTPEQAAAARASRDVLQASDRFRERRIVTEIVPACKFWPAEDYHQRYYEKHGIRGGCRR